MDAQTLRQDASRVAQDLVREHVAGHRTEVFHEFEVTEKRGLFKNRPVRSTVREVESVIEGWRLWRQITDDEVKSGGFVRQMHIELWLTVEGNFEVVTTEEVTWAGGNGQRDQAVSRRQASDEDLCLPGAQWESVDLPLLDIFYSRSQWRPAELSGGLAPVVDALERLLPE